MDWVACVGVDWADQKHDYAVRTRDGRQASGQFPSTPEGVHGWVQELREQNPGGEIVVALEQSRGALMYALSAYDFLRLVPINPRAACAYRQSLHLSGAKDDPVDAVLLRDFAASHLDQLRVWRPDHAVTRQLRLLVEARRNMVDQRTAFILELTAVLKQYFPQILEWFRNAGSEVARSFLMRWPTLQHVQSARSEAIRGLIRKNSRKSPARIEEIIDAVRRAVPLTSDHAINEALSLRAELLASMIECADRGVTRYDDAIATLWATHEDVEVFASFPGAGPVIAPRLAAAFGSDRDRFASAVEMQTYSGIAPVVERSGKQCWTHARWHCPKFLRQTFHEFAEASIPHCRWAKLFYRQQRARGAGHHAAIRSLAFRWIRILFKCWKTNKPYDDSAFIAALGRRGSPLADQVAA
jgi:transposase